ncbi:hypothetical protein GCM10022225_80600 [Plantactinospora mayteni]|uniref:Uncharacterized protein n=1 Tax=Plantactinospora mayteni TaxID=566021 RepID=A0ABQ4F3I1_9ACTN|nr:hypothetical protein [Plantactinospora mayteni]GIH01458.1 hypothetical protein Pma05_80300 [Plantactinospora mayteni]
MVVDNELGLGSFLPITEEDREIVRQAKMLHIRVAPQERDDILAVAQQHTDWQHLSDADFDQRVFDEVAVLRYPRAAPSLLDVRVVMAALRAGHLS